MFDFVKVVYKIALYTVLQATGSHNFIAQMKLNIGHEKWKE